MPGLCTSTANHSCWFAWFTSTLSSKHAVFPRLALVLILQSAEDDLLAFLGIPCGTFIRVSMGSTQRCPFLPMGSPTALSVYFANKLTSRPHFCKSMYTVKARLEPETLNPAASEPPCLQGPCSSAWWCWRWVEFRSWSNREAAYLHPTVHLGMSMPSCGRS